MGIFILRINVPKSHTTGQRDLRIALPASSCFEEFPALIFVHFDVLPEFGLLVFGRGSWPLVFETAHRLVAWSALDLVLRRYPLEAHTVEVH